MKHRSLHAVLIAAILILPSVLHAADQAAASPQKSVQYEGKVTVRQNYLLSLPDGYEKQDAWPLLIFLHGSGERGSDIELVKKHGPPKLVDAGRKFPFIVVSPQCPKNQHWQASVLDGLLDGLQSKLKVDPKKIYLTGLSMGGQGTYSWAALSKERFAAIVPICGSGDRTWGPRLAGLPTWIFHGVKDTAVPFEKSEQMVKALKNAGFDPKFTIYPEAGHDSWTETYDNPKLYKWLLQQSR
ncbi:MAG: putative peptidase [Planctomycetaceae bacterium]|jgi:predicted peptidase